MFTKAAFDLKYIKTILLQFKITAFYLIILWNCNGKSWIHSIISYSIKGMLKLIIMLYYYQNCGCHIQYINEIKDLYWLGISFAFICWTSLLILEQHSNQPIRYDGQVYSLCQVYPIRVIFSKILVIHLQCPSDLGITVGFRGRIYG